MVCACGGQNNLAPDFLYTTTLVAVLWTCAGWAWYSLEPYYYLLIKHLDAFLVDVYTHVTPSMMAHGYEA